MPSIIFTDWEADEIKRHRNNLDTEIHKCATVLEALLDMAEAAGMKPTVMFAKEGEPGHESHIAHIQYGPLPKAQ